MVMKKNLKKITKFALYLSGILALMSLFFIDRSNDRGEMSDIIAPTASADDVSCSTCSSCSADSGSGDGCSGSGDGCSGGDGGGG